MRRFTILLLVAILSLVAAVSVIAQGESKTLVVGLSEDYHSLDPSRPMSLVVLSSIIRSIIH